MYGITNIDSDLLLASIFIRITIIQCKKKLVHNKIAISLLSLWVGNLTSQVKIHCTNVIYSPTNIVMSISQRIS